MDRNIDVQEKHLSVTSRTSHPPPQPRTWSATQVCALTRNGISDLSGCRRMPHPLSHASQGHFLLFKIVKFILSLEGAMICKIKRFLKYKH